MANRLVSALETRGVLGGMLTRGGSPEFVEVIGRVGFDWVIIDMEHGFVTLETMIHMLRAAEVGGVIPLVRVAENNPLDISRALDIGAAGIVVPHVKTADDLRRVVEACHYAPEGSRGACAGVRSIRYGLEDWDTYRRRANEDVIVVPIIEDRQAVENFDEILMVEGADIYFLGPRDLSQSYGLIGADLEHPEMRAIVSEVVKKARSAGKNMMTLMSLAKLEPKGGGKNMTAPSRDLFSFSYAEHLVDLGFRLLLYSNDISVFARICQQPVNDILRIREKPFIRL